MSARELWTPRQLRARRRLARTKRAGRGRCIAVCFVSVVVGLWAGMAYLSDLLGRW